jgi:uncharacterized protein YprB with RNaseH-like and TPR domain
MLRQTFVHLPGVGAATERKLWESGIRDWNELRREAGAVFAPQRVDEALRLLDLSEEAHEKRNPHFFYKRLPREQLWRVVPEFIENAAYLDIETTGLGHPPKAHSTTISFVFRGEVLQAWEPVAKRMLIEHVLEESSILVSFFGEVFDVPFLQAEFGIAFEKAHLDLCFWLKRHGIGGGLKKVQKNFPEIPDRNSLDINGYDAVKLWRLHERGIEGALETLLTYNAEDTIVLEPLLVRAFNLEAAKQPELGATPLAPRPLAPIRTRLLPDIYEMLR